MTASRLIAMPLVDLLRCPDGPRDRQLLMGESVTVTGVTDGWAEVRAARDGYPGFVPMAALTEGIVTHRVSARATHVYPKPDFKARELFSLGHGACLEVLSDEGRFAETPQGYVPHAPPEPTLSPWPRFILAPPIFGAAIRVSASTALVWCRQDAWPAASPAPVTVARKSKVWGNTCQILRRFDAAIFFFGAGMWRGFRTLTRSSMPTRITWPWPMNPSRMPSPVSRHRATAPSPLANA